MRRGFSLVEMLVVLAITALVMSLLATAYVMELRAIRSAKGLLEMDEQLAAAERQIRYYLRLPHFEGNRRVSEIDPRAWTPSEGYFEIFAPSPANDPETRDWMRFTVRLPGNRPDEWFATSVPITNTASEAYPLIGVPLYKYSASSAPPPATPPPPPPYLARWLEVAFFLSPQTDPYDPTKPMATVPPDHPGYGSAAQLYRLHLRKAALVSRWLSYPGEQPIDINSEIQNGRLDFSVSGTVNPYELRASQNQNQAPPSFRPYTSESVQSDPLPIQSSGDGRDILVNNVVSFDIKVFSGSSRPPDSSYASFRDDGRSAPSGLEIRIRVFNPKTQQMRDIVILESL